MFAYPSFFLNLCYRTYFFSWIVCKYPKSPYLCNVFFIVLDLRLTKVGVQRYSFFLPYTFLLRAMMYSFRTGFHEHFWPDNHCFSVGFIHFETILKPYSTILKLFCLIVKFFHHVFKDLFADFLIYLQLGNC